MKRERLISGLNFIAWNGFCCLLQLIVLFILVLIKFMLWMGLGQLLFKMLGNAELGIQYATFISSGIIFILYTFVWFIIWMILFNGEIGWIYSRIAFSTLPLVVALFMFNPKPVPMAMIPLTPGEIKFQFCTIITGIVLFPLYSIGIHKFVLMKRTTNIRIRNSVYVCLTMIGIGSILFLIGWNIMQDIYN